MRRLTIGLAFPRYGLFLHYGDAGPVHLHIQDGNGFADDHRQIQLHGALNLLLLPMRKIFSDRFRRALHGFGGDLQASQEFHRLASVVEGSFLAHRRQHAAHARRQLRPVDVQFDVRGKLSGVTSRTLF